jgi:hypothetical protein
LDQPSVFVWQMCKSQHDLIYNEPCVTVPARLWLTGKFSLEAAPCRSTQEPRFLTTFCAAAASSCSPPILSSFLFKLKGKSCFFCTIRISLVSSHPVGYVGCRLQILHARRNYFPVQDFFRFSKFSGVFLQLAKKESVTAVQCAFRTQFHSDGWFIVKLCAKWTLYSC